MKTIFDFLLNVKKNPINFSISEKFIFEQVGKFRRETLDQIRTAEKLKEKLEKKKLNFQLEEELILVEKNIKILKEKKFVIFSKGNLSLNKNNDSIIRCNQVFEATLLSEQYKGVKEEEMYLSDFSKIMDLRNCEII